MLVDLVVRARRETHAQAVTARRVAKAGRPLELSADQEQLGLHVIWLQHAANELDRGTADGSFIAVLRALETTRLRWSAQAETALR